MKNDLRAEVVFFEPWSLGDVMIAASTLRELPYPAAIACHSAWHSLLRHVLSEKTDLEILPVDLAYTTRNRTHALEFTRTEGETAAYDASVVLSIRGDPRDFLAARKLFPKAQIRMRGWVRFLARKSSLVDFPYAHGILPVQNRYYSWAKLAGISFERIQRTYLRLQSTAPLNRRIVIHVGAQWRSKQFPDVARLRDLLREQGYEVVLVVGDHDPFPEAVAPATVVRAVDEDLLGYLRSAEHVITNDSGPMHLAAFLGCRTTVLVRTSSIEEWLPPGTRVVASPQTPRGYRQKKNYMTDKTVPEWPSVATVAESLRAQPPKQYAELVSTTGQ